MLFTAKHTVQPDHAVLSTHPPPYTPGPYAAQRPPPATRVPSLVALCIRALVPFPDQVHQLPVRLPLRVPQLLNDLVPDPALLDPRLWAALVQICDGLPPFFASYNIPLADVHLPLLQSIPATPSFSLLTLLSLPGCPHLTDDTILQLKFLHSLSAFDASNTALSSYAIQSLAATLQLTDDSSHRGPWAIRVLSLRNCRQITNDVFPSLLKFPLLSVIDLRATRCFPNASTTTPFKPCSLSGLYHPASLESALSTLYDVQPNLFSSSNPHILNITTLHHRPSRPTSRASTVAPQDAFVVIPSDQSRIKVGNSVVLEKQIQAREDAIAHERNKEAWYDRQERIELRMDDDPFEGRRNRQPYVESSLKSFISSPTNHIPERQVGQARDATRASKSSWTGNPLQRETKPRPSRPTVFGGPMLVNHADSSLSSRAPSVRPGITSDHVHSALPSPSALTDEQSRLRNPVEHTRLRVHTRDESLSPPPSLGELHFPAGTQAQAAADQFYQSIPRERDTLSDSNRAVERASDLGTFDTHLRLYRPPPPWSSLESTLVNLQTEQARAAQERLWQRQSQAAANKEGELAVVDMASERAARVKRELERVVEEAAKRRKVGAGVSMGQEDQIENDEDGQGRSQLHRRYSRPNPRPAAPPMSAMSMSMLSASLPPTQPLVTESTSKNPFRRRNTSSLSTPAPAPTAPAPAFDFNFTSARPSPSLPFNFADDTPTQPWAAEEQPRPKPKPLLPISAVKVPVLPPEIHREALKRERESSSSSSSGSAPKKRSTPALPQAKKARLDGRRRSSAGGGGGNGQFDWKSWGGSNAT